MPYFIYSIIYIIHGLAVTDALATLQYISLDLRIDRY